MEFNKDRVYSAINANELRPGDKVCVADTLMGLENRVRHECVAELEEVLPDYNEHRFKAYLGIHNLAYLVERKENCTNCGNRGNSYCSCFTRDKSDDELSRTVCSNYIRLSESKTEQKAEPHYRPFRDTDELIKVFCEKTPKIYDKDDEKLFMPYIWVRNKSDRRVWLITEFDNRILDYLFTNCEFLDGSVCGVEE